MTSARELGNAPVEAIKYYVQRQARHAFFMGKKPEDNPYFEAGSLHWIYWASHYGTLAHAMPNMEDREASGEVLKEIREYNREQQRLDALAAGRGKE